MSRKELPTLLIAVIIVYVCGCSQNTLHHIGRDALTDSLAVYREQARMGDSTVYLRMAELCLQDENVERGTLWALSMAAQAEEWEAIESWREWGLSMPKYLPVHHVTEVLTDIAYHRFDEARAKSKRLSNSGFHPDWIDAVIALENHKNEDATTICQRMIDDGSLMGRLLYCLVTNDVDSILALSEVFPVLYIDLAERARYSEHGKDSDEVSENVPKYYLKADENGCLDKQGARMLLAYYNHLLHKDSLAVAPEEYARMKRLAIKY